MPGMAKKPSSVTATRSVRAAIDQLNRTLLFLKMMDRLPHTKTTRDVCKRINRTSRKVHTLVSDYNNVVKEALNLARNSE